MLRRCREERKRRLRGCKFRRRRETEKKREDAENMQSSGRVAKGVGREKMRGMMRG